MLTRSAADTRQHAQCRGQAATSGLPGCGSLGHHPPGVGCAGQRWASDWIGLLFKCRARCKAWLQPDSQLVQRFPEKPFAELLCPLLCPSRVEHCLVLGCNVAILSPSVFFFFFFPILPFPDIQNYF